MMRVLLVLSLLILETFSVAQQPTFLRVFDEIKGTEIAGIRGFFPHTDSTYVGFFLTDEGLSRTAPYYVIFDLDGDVTEEKKISIDYPFFLYMFENAIKTSDGGYLIKGKVDGTDIYPHYIKFSSNLEEEWRITNDSSNNTNFTSFPANIIDFNEDLLLTFVTDSSYLLELFNNDLSQKKWTKEIPIDTSNKPFSIHSTYVQKETIIVILISNLDLGINRKTEYYFIDKSIGTYFALTKDSLEQKFNFGLLQNSENSFIGLKRNPEIGHAMQIMDTVFSEISYIESPNCINEIQLLDFFIEKHSIHYFLRSIGEGLGNDDYIDLHFVLSNNGTLIRENVLGYNNNQDFENLSLFITLVQKMDDSYFFMLTPTPGVPRTLSYIMVTDSNLKVNGLPFQNYFIDSTSSIHSIQETSEISIYPNPTSTQFTIQTNSNKQTEYSLYSLNGQIVETGIFLSQTQIDVSEFTKGVYLLYLQSEEGVAVKKLVVK